MIRSGFSNPVSQILSGYCEKAWVLGNQGVITPSGTCVDFQFSMATGGELNFEEKLPVCYVNENLELCYGLVKSGFEVVSRVSLGISLNLWSFGYLGEKVLVFWQSCNLHCFSFSKERTIRKVKVGEILKITCYQSKTYVVRRGKTAEVVEWRMNTGCITVLKVYDVPVTDISINSKGNCLAVVSSSFIEILRLTQEDIPTERFAIDGITASTWVTDSDMLYVVTNNLLLKLTVQEIGFECEEVLKFELNISEILESSGEIYLKTPSTWVKYSPVDSELVPESIEKIDEVVIGPHKAAFTDLGLLYENTQKALIKLCPSESLSMLPPHEIDSEVGSDPSLTLFSSSTLLLISELENNTLHFFFWRLMQELFENNCEEIEDHLEKTHARIKERSVQSSPGNITPIRGTSKRSVSPLNKSRKSITPQRMQKMQSDPKELIQLAVDTSCLLSSTQNFTKEAPLKAFYPLESTPNLNRPSLTTSDYLTADKKSLIKKLQGSTEESDLLMSCIIAGSLGRQELAKAVEVACGKLSGAAGVNLNLVLGSKSKAWEILGDNVEDVAYYSRITGRNDEFFAWIINLYEDGFGFISAVQLMCTGYVALAMQIFCKVGEERLVYWIAKYLEGNCRNRKEIPADFEGWLYELGPPRFKSRMEEEITAISVKYHNLGKKIS